MQARVTVAQCGSAHSTSLYTQGLLVWSLRVPEPGSWGLFWWGETGPLAPVLRWQLLSWGLSLGNNSAVLASKVQLLSQLLGTHSCSSVKVWGEKGPFLLTLLILPAPTLCCFATMGFT